MENARILGNNIKLLLKEKGTPVQDFADTLGYSVLDVQKLCDARLFTTEDDIADIAKYFEIDAGELLSERSLEQYSGDGFLHCMGQFKHPENKQKILDIFDMYCDLKEALELNK